jgi:hypothetical protein
MRHNLLGELLPVCYFVTYLTDFFDATKIQSIANIL